MKIDGVPGEHLFPAAYNYKGMWEVSTGFFKSQADAEEHFKAHVPTVTGVIWPVERVDNGSIYLVAPEEYQ